MSGEVKRYTFICDIEDREYVEAEDHDRIVSSLRRALRRTQARVDQLTVETNGLHELLRSEHTRTETARTERDTLRAEVERLRKDAERYRWARRPESGNALFTFTSIGKCGPAMDAAIDAAMEASR